MEAIIIYLDNMFASLPKTEAMQKIKIDLLASMEEKYTELKKEGKSDNEVIGIVISEFGSIDELISDLEITSKKSEVDSPTVSSNEAADYLTAKKHSGRSIGLGVLLCIMAPAILVLITRLAEDGIFGKVLSDGEKDLVSMIPFFIILACGVGTIIKASFKLNKYDYLMEDFNLPTHVKSNIMKRNDSYTKIYRNSVIFSVCLYILSPITLFVTNESDYGVVVLLVLVAIAVYILIYVGNVRGGYGRLLKRRKMNQRN